MDELLAQVEARFGVTAADGLQLLSAAALVARPFDPGMALVIVPGTAEAATPIHGRARHGASPATLLQALYPADHTLHLLPDGVHLRVGTIIDAALDSSQ